MTVLDYINTEMRTMKIISARMAFQFHLDPDDLMQDCVIKAIKYGAKYEDRDVRGFMAWWSQLCYREAVDANAKVRHFDISQNRFTASPATRLSNRQYLVMMYKSIRHRFGSRNSIIMYLLSYGYQYDDIAWILKMEVNTVRSAINRTRIYLEKSRPFPSMATKNGRDIKID